MLAPTAQSQAPELIPRVYVASQYTAPPDAPFSIVIADKDEPGDRLIVTGQALNGTTPVAGVSVYAFHTDMQGRYAIGLVSSPQLNILKNKHGGARAGAGKPKGTKNASTLSKEASREVARQLIVAQLEPLIAAHTANALGIKYLVTRDRKSGKFIRVTEAMAKAKQGHDEEVIEIWEKDPSVEAFKELLNRALDRPKEQEQELKLTGEADLIAALLLGRKRASERKKDQ